MIAASENPSFPPSGTVPASVALPTSHWIDDFVDVEPIGLPRGVAVGLQAGELQHVGLHGGRGQREALDA